MVERITEFYSATEWVRTYRDMTGRILRQVYPPAVNHADGAESVIVYNDLGQKELQVDPDGVQSLFSYDNQGRLSIQVLDLNRDAEIDYSGEDRIVRTMTEYGWRDGIPVRRILHSRWESSGSDDETTFAFTETSLDGFESWQTSHGLTVHTQVEANFDSAGGRRETTTYPDGTSFVRTFSNGRLSAEISRDTNGQTLTRTDYLYDSHGRLYQEIVQGMGTTTYTWNANDQIESVTTPDPEPSLTGVGYDAQTTTFFYDLMGRIERMDHPDNTSTHHTYWPTGQVRRTWGSRQYPVEYTYTSQGRLDTLTTWQDFSNPTTATVTQWTYDPFRGWLTSKEIADSGELVTWQYTPAGRLEQRTNGRGIVASFQYTDGGDLEVINYSDATPSVTHTFDRLGRVATTTDASGERRHLYQADRLTGEQYLSGPLADYGTNRQLDSLQRIQKIVLSFNGTPQQQSEFGYHSQTGRLQTITANGLTHDYSYVPLSGLPESRTVSDDSANVLMVVDHDWDFLGRLRSIDTITAADHRSFAYRYNDANQRTRVTLADDRYWSYDYDSLGQLTSAAQYNGADQPIPGRDFGFTFDDIGNRTQTVTNGRSATYTPNGKNQYEERQVPGVFDLSGLANSGAVVTVNGSPTTRLGEWFHGLATADNSSGAIWDEVTIRGVLAGAGNAGTDAVAETEGAFFLPATPQVFIHDADGNLTQDGQWLYVWDAENRLIQMETLPAVYSVGAPRLRLTFQYDSQGRRFSKTVENWDEVANDFVTTSNRRFLYDGWNLIAELTTDESGDYPINRRTFYIWGTDLSGSLQGAGGVVGLLAVRQENISTSLPYFAGVQT